MVKTKIIATLGPASSSYSVIRKMVLAGLDVARLNFSHGGHKAQLQRILLVREINKKYRRHIRLMQDLEGLRIRVGRFGAERQKELIKGATVWLAADEKDTYVDLAADERDTSVGPAADEVPADKHTIPFDYKGDLRKIGAGKLIYIDDGTLILRVKSSNRKRIEAKVMEGGILKERKGINIPDVRIPFSGMTEKDKKDIEFGISHKVDYVAQSFVRRKRDVEEIKGLVKPRNPQCMVVAKIESREAIRNIDGIIDASDGIMIARGDMGIAVPIYQIPMIQKSIIRKCNQKKKFVITATQMLEHMTEHSRPTRAEVTDVANAILDGTDFVMLSAETAAGRYPAESVEMMNQIIKFTEENAKNR